MSHGLNITFDALAKTPNEAAVAVLVPALDSPDAGIRSGALAALLKRSSPGGHREILRRGHILGKSLQSVFSKTPGKMQPALRESVLGSNRQMCFNACQAILWSREYDLFPVLLTLAEAPEHPHADLGRKTALQLAELLLEELHGPRINARRRDPQIIRRHAIACLEKSLFAFSRHQAWEVVEAYLTLAQRDDAGLRTILLDPQHSCLAPIIGVFVRSACHGVARLLASFLDDPYPPKVMLKILIQRSDAEFVDILLKRIGESLSVSQPATSTIAYLRMVEHANISLAWATPLHRLVASVLGLLIVILVFFALRRKKLRIISLTLLGLTVFLAVLGIRSGSLHSPAIVMGNLVGGFSMLGLLGWMVFSPGSKGQHDTQDKAGTVKHMLIFAIIVLSMQIVLGGLTSANFAATACQTLPDCHGSWSRLGSSSSASPTWLA